MPCNDGTPEDVLRFQRDVLGCQVLSLTDHVEYMSAVEFRYLMDTLATERSDEVVVLYGAEWAKLPAHDTNFFACQRQVFDRLRAILLAETELQGVFARIKAELPPGSVVAVRHFHGRRGEPHGIDGARVTDTRDSEIEWAMEVVQTRGDMMVDPPAPCSPFPAAFLQAGADIGLVGGSDHSRGGPLKYCLTGFWVRELSAEGVFEALRQGRTIASASGKVAMWAAVAGDAVRLAVSSPTALQRAELWVKGEWVERVKPEGKQAEIAWQLPQHGPGGNALVVRVEAAPLRPGWPNVVGYARPKPESNHLQ
jgi:hypothetical protein